MGKTIRDIMTTDPVIIQASDTILEAARAMRGRNIGDVVVQDGNLCGILTDRDIVVRMVAEGKDPGNTKIEAVCSRYLATLSPSASVEEAVELMRHKSVRRIPVTEKGKVVGIVSIGDLAIENDRSSALADISAAPPNR